MPTLHEYEGMNRRRIEYHKIATAVRRAGRGAGVDAVAAFYRAPTLAGELGGQYSAELLGELSDRVARATSRVTPLQVDPALFKKVERMHKFAAPVGGAVGLITGSFVFGVYDPPLGFLLGLLVPGFILAVVFPPLFQRLSITCTVAGRKAVAMAYGVHLRTQQTAAHWHSLTWRDFEIEVADLFRRLNYTVEHTGRGGDKGVDIVAAHGESRLLIQCKKYGKPVGPGVVREMVGALVLQKGEWGVLVSSLGFTSSAADAARGVPILLLDVNDLLQIQKRGTLADYLPG